MRPNTGVHRAMRFLFAVALLSTLGSMYYGYYGDPVANAATGQRFVWGNGLAVCDMCWYIRICTYPLVIILGLAIAKKDLHSLDYVLPLVIISLLFSAYKYWLQKFSSGTDFGFCTSSSVPCSDIAVEYFGFITMPFFGIVSAICMIAVILWINKHR